MHLLLVIVPLLVTGSQGAGNHLRGGHCVMGRQAVEVRRLMPLQDAPQQRQQEIAARRMNAAAVAKGAHNTTDGLSEVKLCVECSGMGREKNPRE